MSRLRRVLIPAMVLGLLALAQPPSSAAITPEMTVTPSTGLVQGQVIQIDVSLDLSLIHI